MRIQSGFGEADGSGGLSDASRNELELAGEGADISDGEDAGTAGFVVLVYLDLVLLNFQSPVLDGAEVAFEPDVDDDGVAVVEVGFFGLGVFQGDAA